MGARSVWKELEVLPVQLIARNTAVRARVDLRNCLPTPNARLYLKAGRTGTTALTTALAFRINVLMDKDQADPFADPRLGDLFPIAGNSVGPLAAGVAPTISADALAGQNLVTVSSATGLAANDDICIADGGGGLTRVEWNQIIRVNGTQLTLSANLRYPHLASQNDVLTNKAGVVMSVSASQVLNGALTELVMDYGAATTGESLIIHAFLQYPTFNLGNY